QVEGRCFYILLLYKKVQNSGVPRSQFTITMDSLVPMKEIMIELDAIHEETFNERLPKSFTKAVEKMLNYAQGSEKASEKFHEVSSNMKENKKVRIVSAEVPHNILPSAILHDIKVNGHGADDEMYNKHAELRKMIPRGATIMEFNNTKDVVIYANKKFVGGVGDEDEVQPENNDIWKQYCLEDPDTATKVICMEKLNGEAAHFSVRYIEGLFCLITGSKNVHMLIRKIEDIEQYSGERFTVAKVMARAVWNKLYELESRHRHLLFSLMHHTKCTAVCEIFQPDHQHIIKLKDDLKQPQLNVISFTPVYSENEESSLLALPPHHTLNLLSALGFATPSYSVIATEDVINHQNKVRGELHKEGEVLYFLNKAEETIGIAKSKTFWYIMIRALREKAAYCFITRKKRHSWNLEDNILKTQKRLEELQPWLKFSDSYLKSWKELGEAFLKWLNEELQGNEEAESIRPRFPIIWEKFLLKTGLTDEINS
ncbi:hypothetical protein OTU49_004647, partial [Cherax quadricarinatus]